MPSPLFVHVVPGTPWHVIITDDARHFYFNSATKSSVWQLADTGDLHLAGAINYDELGVLFAKARGLLVSVKNGNESGSQISPKVNESDCVSENVDESEQEEVSTMELLRSVFAENNIDIEGLGLSSPEHGEESDYGKDKIGNDGEHYENEHAVKHTGIQEGLALGYSSDEDLVGLDLDVNADLDLSIDDGGKDQVDSRKGEYKGGEKSYSLENSIERDVYVNADENHVHDTANDKGAEDKEVDEEDYTNDSNDNDNDSADSHGLDLSTNINISLTDVNNFKKLLDENKECISLYDPWSLVQEELLPKIATRGEFYAIPDASREQIFNSWVSGLVDTTEKPKYPTPELLFFHYLQDYRKDIQKTYFGEFYATHEELQTLLENHPLPKAESLYRHLRVELVDFAKYERTSKRSNPTVNLKVQHVQKFLARNLGVKGTITQLDNLSAFDQWVNLLNDRKVNETIAHHPANYILGDEKRLKCYVDAITQ